MNKTLELEDTFICSCDLKIPAQNLAQEFGYNFERQSLQLPKYRGELNHIQKTQEQIQEILPHLSLDSDRSKREFLVAPIMRDLICYTHTQIRIEYKIKVSDRLQGIINYFIQSTNFSTISFAKGENLEGGTNQLITQLIALDQWDNTPASDRLFGAVTTGTVWQFALLHRQTKLIQQDLNLYRVPNDFEAVTRILVEVMMEKRGVNNVC
jgi:hypothetical protein